MAHCRIDLKSGSYGDKRDIKGMSIYSRNEQENSYKRNIGSMGISNKNSIITLPL